jgi:hypothetical protein
LSLSVKSGNERAHSYMLLMPGCEIILVLERQLEDIVKCNIVIVLLFPNNNS